MNHPVGFSTCAATAVSSQRSTTTRRVAVASGRERTFSAIHPPVPVTVARRQVRGCVPSAEPCDT